MKKVLMIALIIGFVWAGNAVADEFVFGDMTVLNMRIFDNDDQPCDVIFFYVTTSGQEYTLFGDAVGTQLNLALWKAALDGVVVEALLRYRITPLFINIEYVEWPA